jgi:hypothetical protein
MPNEEIVCCLELPTRLNCHSPFLDDCSTSYYDGSIEGITRCAVCSRVYRYGIVAWDDDPEDVEVRIFLFDLLMIASPPNQSLKSIEQETRNIKLQESKFTLVLAAKYFQSSSKGHGSNSALALIQGSLTTLKTLPRWLLPRCR